MDVLGCRIKTWWPTHGEAARDGITALFFCSFNFLIMRPSEASLCRGSFVSVSIHIVQLREKILCSSFDGALCVFKLWVIAGWH